MSARMESLIKELANMTVPTVPATLKTRGGHDRDRHIVRAFVRARALATARNCP